jgi:hypothetical protein
MSETIGPSHHNIEGFSSNSFSEEGATTFVVRKRLHPVLRDDIFKSASVRGLPRRERK